MERRLILVVNDDGIMSEGLWATVEAVMPLGEILVVAPDRQWSGAGRSMPKGVTGRLTDASRVIDGEEVRAYAVDASPAQAVGHAVLELAPRRPDIVISGVNFGANLGIEVTISGTVGAALEAAAFGIPAMAVSQEMAPKYAYTGDDGADYSAAQMYARKFADLLLTEGLPRGIDVLNINVPEGATLDTFWRVTRLSRHRYFEPLPPDRENGGGRAGYRIIEDPAQTEIDSDIKTVLVARLVSVTPLSLDMTARVNLQAINARLHAELARGARLPAMSSWLMISSLSAARGT
ncbi:MAG: 5'/3'-nucleotidase SurE [Anaerolineae bacterium]